jgi:hypothetical protein
VTLSPAIPDGKDAFAQLRRCAGGRARLTDAACAGRLMEGAGMPDRPRQLLAAAATPAGVLLPPQGDHLPCAYHQNDQVGPKAAEDQPSCRGINVLVRGQEQRIRPYACIHRGCRCDHPAGPEKWLLALYRGGYGRLCRGQPGRDAGGEGGQLRIGPRRERLATRRSNSSLSSRPCTNAALRVSITCSRSACDARM